MNAWVVESYKMLNAVVTFLLLCGPIPWVACIPALCCAI